MDKLISVIIPVYNSEKYLKDCVASVLKQTYENFEIILINDGSTDNSGDICNEFKLSDKRIKVINKQNGGVSSARNAGIDISSGDYIVFVDSDDYIKEDMLRTLYNMVYNEEDIIAVTGLEYSEDGINFKAQTLPVKDKIILRNDAILYQWQDEQALLGPCAKLFSSKIIKGNNIFFDEKIYMGEDRLFVAEILLNSKGIIFSDKVFYRYRWNEESMCRSSYDQKYFTVFNAFDKIRNFTDDLSLEIENASIITCMAHASVYTADIASDISLNSADKQNLLKQLKIITKRYIKDFMKLDFIDIKAKIRVLLLFNCPNITAKIYRKLKGTDLK